jgi:hypothetical protein
MSTLRPIAQRIAQRTAQHTARHTVRHAARHAARRTWGIVPPRDEDGSSLPELLVAAGLGVIALAVLGTGMLGPLRSLEIASRTDPRAEHLEVVRLELQRIVRAARPGLDEPAAQLTGANEVELRIGDLSHADVMRIALADDGLLIDADGVLRHVPVQGLDVSRSAIRLIDRDGALVEAPGSVAAVALHVMLHLHGDDAGPLSAPHGGRPLQRPRGELRAEYVIGLRATDVIEEVAR